MARRWIVRWALIAFGLYHLTMLPNDYPSFGGGGFRDEGLAISWGHVFGQVGVWVAHTWFGLDGPMPAGLSGDNGDTAEEFARLLVGVVIAIVAASIWTWADRKRPGARWVEPVLHAVLRYAIALGLASYAVAKILPIQFAPLDAVSRESRLGELTPMRLMWNFMEYSRAYSAFAGLAEMTVVVLVAFRRTATIGALLCIVVMANVALMDVCFDVPVKLFSISMVVTAAAIVVFDLPRLAAVLLHRPVVPPPVPPDPVFSSRAMNLVGWATKIVLIGGAIASSFVAMTSAHVRSATAVPAPLQGTWQVAAYAERGREVASASAPTRWRRLAIGEYGIMIRRDDETPLYCGLTAADPVRLALACSRRTGGQAATLTWARQGDQLRLDGTFDGAPVTVTLQRVDDAALPLAHHTTHWITDG
jgi:hypothetical protein